MFLTEFVPNMKRDGPYLTNAQNESQQETLNESLYQTEFAHLDIAGVMNSKGPQGYLSSGMTGRPTRSLIQMLSKL